MADQAGGRSSAAPAGAPPGGGAAPGAEPGDTSAGLAPGFPLARLRFEAVARARYLTPDFAGSVLRGAFGHALRRLVCMTGESDCAACPLYRRCPYPEIFAPPPLPTPVRGRALAQPPVPYVIEPPPIGRRWVEEGAGLSFHMLLIGPAAQRIPYIVEAMRRALKRGLGAKRAALTLERVYAAPPRPAESLHGDHRDRGPEVRADTEGGAQSAPLLYDFADEEAETAPLSSAMLDSAGLSICALLPAARGPSRRASRRIRIRHLTPLRLQRDGRLLDHRRLQPRDLLVAAWRRLAFLEAAYGTGEEAVPPLGARLDAAAAVTARREDLSWWDWTRRSSRQGRRMTIGGVRGSWLWVGDGLERLMPLLLLGAVLHVGKETSFGFGRYAVEIVD